MNQTREESESFESLRILQIETFIDKIKDKFPKERINLEPEKEYGQCTTGEKRAVLASVKVNDEDEIEFLLQNANQYLVSLYPISTGKNWGYGSALPVENFCVIVDLSLMNKVLDCNPKLGWVRIQPGVTQAQLRKYFDDRNYPFLVPTTGAGPHCSVLGNALERGYGITPHKDHFEAVLALTAILPTGEKYHSVMKDLGGEEIHHNFKWGIGPHIDSLFSQSNFGIVTEATIALARQPEHIEIFSFDLKDNKQLPQAVAAIQKISREFGHMLSGINLMNQRRVLSMKIDYPYEELKPGQKILDNRTVDRIGKSLGIPAWTGIGAIYGTENMVAACKKEISKILTFADRTRFINSSKVALLARIANYVPAILGGDNLRSMTKSLLALKNILEGRPNTIALPLVYWKSKQTYNSQSQFQLQKDSCGLLWYSPLVVMDEDKVLDYVEFVEKNCTAFQIDPLITLTSVSERCFDSTVPILFDKSNIEEQQRATACFNYLFDEGQKKGYFPYRVGIQSMEKITSSDSKAWKLIAKIKSCFDPNHILAPGRYCRTK